MGNTLLAKNSMQTSDYFTRKRKEKEESIDISRIKYSSETEDILKQFICPICLQIVNISHKNPPIASRNCSHFFCWQCISNTERFQLTSKCPVCKIPVEKQEMRKRHPQLVNILETFSVKCKRVDKGCDAVVKLRSIFDHEEIECRFAKQKCPFSALGCGFRCPRGAPYELIKHQSSCSHAVRICPHCMMRYHCIEDAWHVDRCMQLLLRQNDDTKAKLLECRSRLAWTEYQVKEMEEQAVMAFRAQLEKEELLKKASEKINEQYEDIQMKKNSLVYLRRKLRGLSEWKTVVRADRDNLHKGKIEALPYSSRNKRAWELRKRKIRSSKPSRRQLRHKEYIWPLDSEWLDVSECSISFDEKQWEFIGVDEGTVDVTLPIRYGSRIDDSWDCDLHDWNPRLDRMTQI
eukprot:TRINITY_DN3496_c0_g1_i6.p1 TRINITY_DN3496_c0_g1~~TRINITY_DN3496_c0_g1_i6.p1  ORF type:complete len:405 (+),score=33.25 TRINITY_DN3496_c0_g1_i6:39-1253(+)